MADDAPPAMPRSEPFGMMHEHEPDPTYAASNHDARLYASAASVVERLRRQTSGLSEVDVPVAIDRRGEQAVVAPGLRADGVAAAGGRVGVRERGGEEENCAAHKKKLSRCEALFFTV